MPKPVIDDKLQKEVLAFPEWIAEGEGLLEEFLRRGNHDKVRQWFDYVHTRSAEIMEDIDKAIEQHVGEGLQELEKHLLR